MERATHGRELQHEFLGTVTTLRDRYVQAGMNPVFYRGMLAPLRTAPVAEMSFDHAERALHVPLAPASFASLRQSSRKEGLGIIVDHSEEDHVQHAIDETQLLLKWQGYSHYPVNTQVVRHASWPRRGSLLQMTPGIESDSEGCRHFVFGQIVSPPLPPDTLSPWDYIFEVDGEEALRLPGLNPAFLGYYQAVSAPRRKAGIDETRTTRSLMRLRQRALQTATEQGVSYDSSAWQDFLKRLQHPQPDDGLAHMKLKLMRALSEELGVLSQALARGKDFFGGG